ncbi:4-alpha-glucanotransferase [Lichenicola sp.]|uniref:4-alpha-glucanotransferase n=1 Tax=Lichenicola sp. TaxID=2804529 RepID=UPI003AFF6187
MSVDETVLRSLAERAGLSLRWRDAFGDMHEIAAEDLQAILDALNLGVSSEAEAHALIARLDTEDATPAPLMTGDAGAELGLPVAGGAWRLRGEDGSTLSGTATIRDGLAWLTLPEQPGYYQLEIDGRELTVAVAPPRCFTLEDALAAANAATGEAPARVWGLAQQLYALRRPGDGGVGDFAALSGFVQEAALHGAAAVTISPVHAQFSADPDRFSPYAPSSRIMLNALHIAVDAPGDDPGEEAHRLEALDLVEWPAVARDRLARLRRRFDLGGAEDPDFLAWRAAEGDKLEAHALFEALHQHLWREQQGAWNWKDWPDDFHDPQAPGSLAFARDHAQEVSFHAWLQYRADRQLQDAQAAAKAAGMPIGLIADLAVGTDAGGSHSWSRQGETLVGLTVGAPPDLLQREGQNWGITAFSARGLRANGYRAFIEMLQGAMRHAGGVRIDHAMGLNRLWIVPEGRSAARGAYLQMPEADLLRLTRLESVRNRAIVLGEDLGTVPEGFTDRLQDAGVDGMRVLWFERDDEGFQRPQDWTRQASAMTSTHDLPTVAGWWKGVDIRHRLELGGSVEDERKELAAREADRALLWQAMQESGACTGPQPAVWDVVPVVDAAVAQVGASACEIAMIPTEDAIGLEEQPNIPGTTTEHPNWRRRLRDPVGAVLSGERTELRLRRLDQTRRG